MLHTKLEEQIKTYFIFNITPENHAVYERDDVEIYGTAKKITDGNIIGFIRFACWVTMVSHIHNYSNIDCFSIATTVT